MPAPCFTTTACLSQVESLQRHQETRAPTAPNSAARSVSPVDVVTRAFNVPQRSVSPTPVMVSVSPQASQVSSWRIPAVPAVASVSRLSPSKSDSIPEIQVCRVRWFRVISTIIFIFILVLVAHLQIHAELISRNHLYFQRAPGSTASTATAMAAHLRENLAAKNAGTVADISTQF